jgi:chorismate mutase
MALTDTMHDAGPRSDPHESLSRCREDIDRVDAVLVALLGERARLALNAGRMKAAIGQPVAASAREAAVLERVRQLAPPPLDPEAAARIFERIIDETRDSEQRSLEARDGA